MRILDADTRDAALAAEDQESQCEALIAPWADGNVTVRVMAGDTLLATLTHGPWVLDTNAEPRALTLGSRLARTFVQAGTQDRLVFRSGSTDVFSLTAGVGEGEVSFPAAISENAVELLDDRLAVTAVDTLPLRAPDVLTATFTADDAITVGTPGAGSVENTGTVPFDWSITVPSGLTVTPSSGTLAAGATQALVIEADTADAYDLTLTAAGVTITGNSQSIVASDPAPSGSITIVETAATYSTLAAAIAAATSGQTITVPAGTTLAEWGLGIGAKTLTIRSATASSPFTIDASGVSSSGGGSIMSIAGGSLTLTDARLTGNKYEYNHNPGITTTASSGSVTLTRVEIDECSNGILQGDTDTTTTFLLTNCNIHDNGDWNGLTHNLYFGKSPSVTLRGCWVHNTKVRTDYPSGQEFRESWGHLVKSRSKVLLVEACRLTMEVYSTTGGANRCIDHPCGGELTVRGCLIEYRTNQNSGQGQAIAWGVEGANRISGTVFDDRLHKINLQQNTIVARSASAATAANRDALWIGVGCISDGSWSNDDPTPAPSEFNVVDNVWCGWDDSPPRVNEGPSATVSTTYAIPGASNTVGALALLTDAAAYDYSLVTPVAGSANATAYAYNHPASTVARADSYRGAVYSGWDTGAGTGTIVGDLWTPALGPASKVNAASWATLQVGRVSGNLRAYRIAGTRLDGLDASLKATMLATYGAAWEDVGVSRWSGVTDAWVGLVWDDRTGRERAFIGPGGGHAASGNNGIYQMDVRAFAWSVKSLPTPPTLVTANDVYPSGYQGDTTYPRYTGPYSSPYAGVWSDEVFDPANPTDPVKSSRKPTSRHTYGMQAFRPDLGAEGTIYMLCRRAWKFDVAAGTWSTPVGLNGASDPATFSSAENGFCWWDEVGGNVYLCGNNLSASPDSRNCRWDGASTWSTAGYYPTGGYPLASSQFEKRGRIIHHLQYQHVNAGGADNRPSKPLFIKRHDIDAGTAVTVNITFSGALASATWGLDYQVDYWDVGGITYVEPLGAYLIVIRRQGFGDELAWVDYTTGVCTLASDITGDFGPVYRTEGKIKYVESIGAILHGTSADQNWGVIRVI